MEIDGMPLTDEEADINARAIADCFRILCTCADVLNADRDSYVMTAIEIMKEAAEISMFEKLDFSKEHDEYDFS